MRTIDISNPKNLGALKSGAILNYANFDKSGMQFTLDCARVDSPAPYGYMEAITLLYKGAKVLVGQVTECKQVLAGSSYVWQVSIYDRWWVLENSLMLTEDGLSMFFKQPSVSAIPNFVSTNVRDVLKRVLDKAIEANTIEAYDVSFVDKDATIDNFEGNGSFADVLGSIKGYRPNLISFFDYSRSKPTLVIADQDKAPSYMLDVEKNVLVSVELVPRYDLVPKAVGVVCVTPNWSSTMVSYPNGADLSQPGSVVHKVQMTPQSNDPQEEEDDKKGIDSSKWNFTKQSMEVKGNRLPMLKGEGREFWVEKIPILAKVSNINFLTPRQTAINLADGEMNASYSESAKEYELVSGAVSDKCKTIKWCKTKLEQWIEVRGGDPPPKYRHIFTNKIGEKHWQGLLTWSGVTTNVRKKSYTISPEGTGPNESDDPPKETEDQENEDPESFADSQSKYMYDACKAYFEATRIVPWCGSVTCKCPPHVTMVVGCTLCISGGRKEWESMNTVIQGVSLDAYTGKLSITTGAPDHLSFDTMLERSKLLDQKRKASADNRKQGLTDDGVNQGGMDFEWDNRAKQIPKAPSVSPSGQVALGELDDGFEFGFQVRMIKDVNGQVVSSEMKHGMVVMADSVFMTNAKETTKKDWVDTGIKEGEIWMKLSFSAAGSPPSQAGKFIGMNIVRFGGSNTAFEHAGPTPPKAPKYYFLVARINDGVITQYLMGSAYILVKIFTDFPYGPVI